MMKRELLATYAVMYEGDWCKIAKALKENRTVTPVPLEEKYVTIFDEEYPDCFRQLRFPPWVIFYEGDLSLLNRPAAAIVGSRKINDYGAFATKTCVQNLNLEYVVVSGLARGVDALAHQGAIYHGHRTIGVIGCGLNYPYPKANLHLRNKMKCEHLVISEYPANTKPNPWHFPWRNRLLAAIGDFVIVTQAKYQSGTMCTVKEALELSKDVYVVPWPFYDHNGDGCNLLIHQGASIIPNANFIKEL